MHFLCGFSNWLDADRKLTGWFAYFAVWLAKIYVHGWNLRYFWHILNDISSIHKKRVKKGKGRVVEERWSEWSRGKWKSESVYNFPSYSSMSSVESVCCRTWISVRLCKWKPNSFHLKAFIWSCILHRFVISTNRHGNWHSYVICIRIHQSQSSQKLFPSGIRCSRFASLSATSFYCAK